jgi:hypothetical protein
MGGFGGGFGPDGIPAAITTSYIGTKTFKETAGKIAALQQSCK